ncbi:MAG: DUF1499 domain-containing protein [Chloroflexota bacterium]
MEILIVILGAAALYGAALVIIPMISPMPQNLGVNNGQLKPCPKSPNCVSTQARPDDRTHYMEPIPFEETPMDAQARLLNIINAMPRTQIITEKPNYLHVEFRTAVMRFIDDVEFYIDDDTRMIHFRSASRLGQGDGGTNRRRMQAISGRFRQA